MKLKNAFIFIFLFIFLVIFGGCFFSDVKILFDEDKYYDANYFSLELIKIKENNKVISLDKSIVVSDLNLLNNVGDHEVVFLFNGKPYRVTVKIGKAKEFLINIKDNNLTNQFKLKYNEPLSKIKDEVKKASFKLVGFKDENEKKYDFSYLVKENLTLIPVWEKTMLEYNVTIKLGYDNKTISKKVSENTKIKDLNAPIREGYNFLYFSLEDGTILGDEEVITSDLLIYANWEQKQSHLLVTISLGYDNKVETQSVLKGTKIKSLTKPIRTGYNFLGFFDVEDNKLDEETSILDNIKIKCKWEKIFKKITVEIDFGYNNLTETKETDAYIKIIEVTTFIRPGHTLIGFEVDGVLKTPEFILVKSCKIKCLWIKQTQNITITIVLNNGNPHKTITVKQNTLLKDIGFTPVWSDHIFVGYLKDGDLLSDNFLLTEDVTLTCKWEEMIIKYNIVLRFPHSGTQKMCEVKENSTLHELKIKEDLGVFISGYKFKGFFIGSSALNLNYKFTKNETIVVKYVHLISVTIAHYTENIVNDEFSIKESRVVQFEEGESVNEPYKTYTGFLKDSSNPDTFNNFTASLINNKVKLFYKAIRFRIKFLKSDGEVLLNKEYKYSKSLLSVPSTPENGGEFFEEGTENTFMPIAFIDKNYTFKYYMVKSVTTYYYFENISDDLFVLDSSKTTIRKLKLGVNYDAVILDVLGFNHFNHAESILKIVVSESQFECKVYYKRIVFSLKFLKSTGSELTTLYSKYKSAFNSVPETDETDGEWRDKETGEKYKPIISVERNYIFHYYKGFNFSESSLQKIKKYWKGTVGLEGESLRIKLREIMETGLKRLSYNEVRYALEETDEDPDKPGYVLGMYDRKHYKNKWTGGNPWNREHVWCNSRLGVPRVGGGDRNIASDIHNLRACEKNINSTRNNYPYVEPVDPSSGSQTGYLTTNGIYGFYPGHKCKGDAARIILYMYVMYMDKLVLTNKNNELTKDNYDGNYKEKGYMGKLDHLIKWTKEDKVDNFELHRNELIYTKFQKNRNPFIDVPEFVHLAFLDLADTLHLLQISAKAPDLIWIEDRKIFL